MFEAWNLIALTLFIWLSQRVCDNGLTVKLDILFFNIFYRLDEEANNKYMHCRTPKNDMALTQDVTTSQITKLRLWQPQGVYKALGLISNNLFVHLDAFLSC